jgi:hypothetical protein
MPALLTPGTRVDGWTVVEPHGQGSYGDVYRAVRAGHEQEGPVALKLAHYPGASRLTWQHPPPGTSAYRSWQWAPLELRPLLERNSRMEPLLRGTAVELARALNPLAEDEEEALAPMPDTASQQPAPALVEAPSPAAELRSVPTVPVEHALPQRPARTWGFWLALAAMGLTWLLEWSLRPVYREPERILASGQDYARQQRPGAGSSSVGDSADKDTQASAHGSAMPEAITQEPLPKLQSRQQTQPDTKGRCPAAGRCPSTASAGWSTPG